MNDIATVRIALTQIHQQFRQLDLDLPEGFVERRDEIRNVLEGYTPGHDAGVLANAVANALLAGKDPAADSKVRGLLVTAQLEAVNLRDRMREVAGQRQAALLSECTPQIIDTLATVVADADARIVAARDAISDLDLDNIQFGSNLQPAHMALWGHAREAAARVAKVMKVWTVIASASGFAAVTIEARPLAIADLTAEELRKLGSRADAAAVIGAGHRLSLATPDEFHRRVARVTQQRAEAQAQAEREAEHYARTGQRPRYAAVITR